MHVIQLGPYPPPEGGVSRNILAIREVLRAQGHRCSIITTSRSTKATVEPDVYRPRSAFALLRLLARLDYDVLHLHVGGEVSARVMRLIAVCAAFGRGRSVLTMHSGGYPLSDAGRAARPRSLRGAIFRRFGRIVAVNPSIAATFARYAIDADRLHTIAPFVGQSPDPAVEVPAPLARFAERHAPFLLAVCLLEETYDLFMQIDALERVVATAPGAGLMIVGSGSLEAELRRAIAAKPYADRILLTGDVDHAVTLHLIDRADVLLRTTRFDGDAIAVREALFLGTPVIATDNDMRPAGVHLIPVHDPDALVEAIGRLANGPRRVKAPKPDDRTNVQKVLAIYETLVGRRLSAVGLSDRGRVA